MSFGGGKSLSKTLFDPIVESFTFKKAPWDDPLINPLKGVEAIQEGFLTSPEMPAVSPAAESVEDTSALKAAARAEAERLRKRQGLKSTILTGSDQSLMTPAQTEKAQALG